MAKSVEFGFKQNAQTSQGQRVYTTPEAEFWTRYREMGLGPAIQQGVQDKFTALKNVGNVLTGKKPDGVMTSETALLYDLQTQGVKGAVQQRVAGAGNALQNNLKVLTGKSPVGIPSNTTGRVIVSN